MGRFVIPIALAASLIIVFSCEQQTDVTGEKTSLLQTDSAFAKMSVEQNAAAAFKSYLAENAMQMPEGHEPIVGRDVIYENMSKNTDKYTLAWEPQDGNVSKSGDLGWTWGNFTFTYTDESGVEQHSYGKYLNVWQKQADGTWKVLVDIGNANPAPEE